MDNMASKFWIHNKVLEKQQKRLVESILESVFMINAEQYQNILEVVRNLKQDIEAHLIYEEMVMDNVDYPNKNNHINEHNQIRNDFIFNQLDYMSSVDLVNEKLNTIVEWFTNHTVCSDNMLSRYLVENQQIK